MHNGWTDSEQADSCTAAVAGSDPQLALGGKPPPELLAAQDARQHHRQHDQDRADRVEEDRFFAETDVERAQPADHSLASGIHLQLTSKKIVV